METKTAIVTKVIENESFYDSKFGKMYKHRITFDNGDEGHYSSKSQECTKFVEGEQTPYTIEEQKKGQYTNVFIKPIDTKAQSNSGGNVSGAGTPYQKQGGSNDESFALSYAKDILIASWLPDSKAPKPLTTTEMYSLAENMVKWMKDKRNPQPISQ